MKWLQRIFLTNDYKIDDTYADDNNDPDSPLKTAAYLDPVPAQVPRGWPAVVTGTVIAGLSGLRRVECRARPAAGDPADDDPAWQAAKWVPARVDPPAARWSGVLPAGVKPSEV